MVRNGELAYSRRQSIQGSDDQPLAEEKSLAEPLAERCQSRGSRGAWRSNSRSAPPDGPHDRGKPAPDAPVLDRRRDGDFAKAQEIALAAVGSRTDHVDRQCVARSERDDQRHRMQRSRTYPRQALPVRRSSPDSVARLRVTVAVPLCLPPLLRSSSRTAPTDSGRDPIPNANRRRRSAPGAARQARG